MTWLWANKWKSMIMPLSVLTSSAPRWSSAPSIRSDVSEPFAACIGDLDAAFVVKRIVNSCSRLRSSCIRLTCFIATDLFKMFNHFHNNSIYVTNLHPEVIPQRHLQVSHILLQLIDPDLRVLPPRHRLFVGQNVKPLAVAIYLFHSSLNLCKKKLRKNCLAFLNGPWLTCWHPTSLWAALNSPPASSALYAKDSKLSIISWAWKNHRK